ncbi:MAG TPA: hypothetical protein VIO33_12680, partial [Burkholderiaceae bacterium]
MTTIVRATLETTADAASTWRQVALRTLDWTAARGIALRDAVVLLPFAALLPHARAAFAVESAWLPRIETPLTLAATMGPAAPAAPGRLSFD